MKRLKVVVIYSEIEWSFLEQRHHFIARRFRDEGFKVVFYQRVIGRIPSIRDVKKVLISQFKRRLANSEGKNKTCMSTAESESIELRRAFFLPPINRVFSIYNLLYWLFCHRRLQVRSLVYSFSNNPWVIGCGRSRASRTVFDIIHNWWSFPWHSEKHLASVEQSLDIFDRLLSDSVIVQKRLARKGYSCKLVLPGAGDAWFSDKSSPDFGAPRPCFFGNLRGNSDLELVERFYDLFDLKIFGRVDISAGHLYQKFDDVEVVENVALPQRLAIYNTLLLPYMDDDFSTTIAPAKYFEALATGMLILTRSDLSHLPGASAFVFRWLPEWSEADFLQKYSDRLSVQHSIYVEQRNFARMHSWENRLDAVVEYTTGGLE